MIVCSPHAKVGYRQAINRRESPVSARRPGFLFLAAPLTGPWLPPCHFYDIVGSMKTTIDAAGRLVVPKALRQALGLVPGQVLEVRAGDGRLEFEVAPTAMRLRKRGKGVVAVPDVKLPPLTAEQVRETLERVRR